MCAFTLGSSKYGDESICVRYRYNSELKVDSGIWKKNRKGIPDNKIMNIKINYPEEDLRNKIKSFRGTWNKEKKVWELSYKFLKSLNLTDRIVS